MKALFKLISVGGAALAAMLTMAPNFSLAQDVSGTYTTIFADAGKPQPVWLSLNNVVPGEGNNYLNYSMPRNCKLYFQYGGELDGFHFFYNTDGGGGFCYKIKGGDLVLKLRQISGRTVNYTLEKAGKVIESNDVDRQ